MTFTKHERAILDAAARVLRDEATEQGDDVPSLAGELFVLRGDEGYSFLASIQRDMERHPRIRVCATVLDRVLESLESREIPPPPFS